MAKTAKATKRFISSGKLKQQIEQRHNHKKVKQQIEKRRGKGKRAEEKKTAKAVDEDKAQEAEDNDHRPNEMTVDDLLGGEFMDDGDSEEEDDNSSAVDDNESFASVDDLDADEEAHKMDLERLKEVDPEFYKYLQENDKELLEFGNEPEEMKDAEDVDVEVDEAEIAMEEEEDEIAVPSTAKEVTKEMLRAWQRSILEHHSLRSLRGLLLAFRAAVHMNEEDGTQYAYSIGSSAVYNKLVVTALKYTSIVLSHHLPYKTLPDGRYKPPAQTKKYSTLQKMILSFFSNVLHLLSQLPDGDMKLLVLSESTKVIPYIVSSRKVVKDYLKQLLDVWSSGFDDVRLTALLAIRRLAASPDQSILDICLKGTYVSLVRSSRVTTVHTLPSINLMKNSAMELYILDHEAAYQHAFRYIRQLAVHLRESMKVKSKEAYKAVYNWQYVHSLDFWAGVLAKACDRDALGESALHPLIYPLVQVTIGAIKLIPTPRYFPLHLHCVRSLLHLIRHTGVFIPLSPFILQILTSSEFSHKPKPSTQRPLDLEAFIRVPAPYVRTRLYQDALAEESAYLLGEWFETCAQSIAFPELAVPVTILVRRMLKRSSSVKLATTLKPLVERLEEHAKWVEKRRLGVVFGPADTAEVERFEAAIGVPESPLGKWVKLQRRARERRKAVIEKVSNIQTAWLDAHWKIGERGCIGDGGQLGKRALVKVMH
ncbi:Noc2-domain-containing protein [Dacryopinax primogenitus]|uniref:Noc2-domain-containing protein n=1 Tax=Dacryopinax primogenitus (strain DJM 731) TaxID=1858805 RepID=M5FQX5_DACPD|nr:Noc2-domain-containing protein [Dacryopinax primogenitus]EJT97184.1 Noc2-domain-containing protein [Dacryopinax primogenitus]